MANWAIVLGVDEYWDPASSLRGAVADALKMVAWLTNQEGGNVPPRNLYLLTSPSPPPLTSPLPPGVNVRDAKFDTLVQTGIDLINKSGGKGERFFFYFSGHGLANNNVGGESSLAFSDFSPNTPHKSVTIASVRQYFGNMAFLEQFFFFDACRNRLDWRKPFRVSEFPFPGEEDPSRLQKVSQCVLSATSPLLRAVEMNEQGAFTGVLLAGLAGQGKAKIYDKDADEYVVRVDRLFAYVEEEVRKKQILVTGPLDPPVYQRVYPETRNVPVPPVLARIPTDAVQPVSLDIFIEPDGLWTQTNVKVRVTSEDTDYDEEVSPVKGVPVPLPPVVLPKSYTVRAEAQGYRAEQRRWPIDLYEPQTRRLKLNPLEISVPVGAGETAPEGTLRDSANNTASEHLTNGKGLGGGVGLKGIDAARSTTTLAAKSCDELAPIEIYNNKGELLAAGQGAVIAEDLEPGFYRARLVTPEGRMVEELVDLSPGEREEVSLTAPSLPNFGLFKEIVEHTQFCAEGDDQTLRFSKDVGPIATPQLTTVLALAGSVIERHYGWGPAVTALGLPSFHEATGPDTRHGLRVICADEADHAEGAFNYLSQVGLHYRRRDGEAEPADARLSLSTNFPGICDFAAAVETGQYVLELRVPERPPVNFSLSVLTDRLTLFVLHRRADGSIRILSFCPSIRPEAETPQKTATNLRRLELLQRFYFADRVDEGHALRDADELLRAKWFDPLAGCLGGYTMLKLGQGKQLEKAVMNLRALYDELPDTHIVAAEYFMSLGSAAAETEARRACVTALDRGLPVFAEGLLRCASNIERLSISHPLADEVMRLSKSRVRNLLWTAWAAPAESAPTGD